ncbi:MAG: hypothetical protein Fur0036_05750 [Fimbriimonadaceae bacterium]
MLGQAALLQDRAEFVQRLAGLGLDVGHLRRYSFIYTRHAWEATFGTAGRAKAVVEGSERAQSKNIEVQELHQSTKRSPCVALRTALRFE